MYGESNCHGGVFRKELLYEATVYMKKYERHWCTKESPEILPIDMLVLARAMTCDGAHYGSHHNASTIHCRKFFVRSNFIALYNYEVFPTTKIP